MRKNIATVSVSGPLDDKLTAIAAAKFDGIELFDADLVTSPMRPAEVAARCGDLGLSIDLYQPVRDVDGRSEEAFEQLLRYLEAKFQVVEVLGIPRILVCSNARADAVLDADRDAEHLARIGDLASDHGVVVAYEALAWGRHVNRVQHAWDRVQRANHPAVTLAVDTFHLLARGDGPASLDGIPGDRIGYLQISDAPKLDLDMLQWSRHYRSFPGQGGLDVTGVVDAVLRAGYSGPLSLEVFSDIIREAPPIVTALDGMRSLLYLEEQLRLRRNASETSPTHRRVALFDPPPAPASVDPAFVEIAVDPSDTGFPALLHALGFRIAGRHRTKPVVWWRNGDAHLVLNASTDLEEHRERAIPSRPEVTALAVLTPDIGEVAARAEALRWPPVWRRRDKEETALPGTMSPSGLTLFLTGSPDSEQHWQHDFEPVEVTDDLPPTARWTGIDHIGLVIDPDLRFAELSFFRTLLGLAPSEIHEFTDPRGRLQSRVMRPHAGSLRVVVAETSTAAPMHRRLGVNQLAFSCDDIFATVESMRAAGVELLDIPDNYYDDLAARLDLDMPFLDRMRRLGVLYDRDETGEFFHVYTHTVGGRFYLEVLQRRGGYDGYGIPNTPVRLAAQASSGG